MIIVINRQRPGRTLTKGGLKESLEVGVLMAMFEGSGSGMHGSLPSDLA